jgi:hypothetical protein
MHDIVEADADQRGTEGQRDPVQLAVDREHRSAAGQHADAQRDCRENRQPRAAEHQQDQHGQKNRRHDRNALNIGLNGTLRANRKTVDAAELDR